MGVAETWNVRFSRSVPATSKVPPFEGGWPKAGGVCSSVVTDV